MRRGMWVPVAQRNAVILIARVIQRARLATSHGLDQLGNKKIQVPWYPVCSYLGPRLSCGGMVLEIVGNAWRRSMSRLTECRHHDPCISLFSDHASILAAKNNPIHHTASSTSRATHDGPHAAPTYVRSYSSRASPRASAAYRDCSIELNPVSRWGGARCKVPCRMCVIGAKNAGGRQHISCSVLRILPTDLLVQTSLSLFRFSLRVFSLGDDTFRYPQTPWLMSLLDPGRKVHMCRWSMMAA